MTEEVKQSRRKFLTTGAAAVAGLRAGDVILEINKNRIANLDNYRNTMDSTEPGQNVLFLIQRGSNTIYVALKADTDDN